MPRRGRPRRDSGVHESYYRLKDQQVVCGRIEETRLLELRMSSSFDCVGVELLLVWVTIRGDERLNSGMDLKGSRLGC